MSTPHSEERNRIVFNTPGIVADYASLDELMPAEAAIFEQYIPHGADVLDLGVGGGRTVPALTNRARRYVAIDYAESMVSACRERYPGVEVMWGDATDLSHFDDGSFDVVVFSFNGIDCLYPDSARHGSLAECFRVLRPGGKFIFSMHNPSGFITIPATRGLPARTGLRRWAKEGYLSLRRLINAARGALWRGEGYVVDPVHGGLLTHLASRRVVQRELTSHGFERVATMSGRYPKRRPPVVVAWYYYVYRRPADERRARGSPLA